MEDRRACPWTRGGLDCRMQCLPWPSIQAASFMPARNAEVLAPASVPAIRALVSTSSLRIAAQIAALATLRAPSSSPRPPLAIAACAERKVVM